MREIKFTNCWKVKINKKQEMVFRVKTEYEARRLTEIMGLKVLEIKYE